jgi:hypothetical protein
VATFAGVVAAGLVLHRGPAEIAIAVVTVAVIAAMVAVHTSRWYVTGAGSGLLVLLISGISGTHVFDVTFAERLQPGPGRHCGVQRGDLDALQNRFFAGDIRYHIPGRSPLTGDYEGVAQVLEMFGRLLQLSGGTLRADLHDVVANDEHAAALVTIRAERAGKQLQDNTVLTFHIRGGRAAEVWSHQTDMYAVDEFWS